MQNHTLTIFTRIYVLVCCYSERDREKLRLSPKAGKLGNLKKFFDIDTSTQSAVVEE